MMIQQAARQAAERAGKQQQQEAVELHNLFRQRSGRRVVRRGRHGEGL